MLNQIFAKSAIPYHQSNHWTKPKRFQPTFSSYKIRSCFYSNENIMLNQIFAKSSIPYRQSNHWTKPKRFQPTFSSYKIGSHLYSNTKSKWSSPDLSQFLLLLPCCSKWPKQQPPMQVHWTPNPRQKRDLQRKRTSAPSNWANQGQCNIPVTPSK